MRTIAVLAALPLLGFQEAAKPPQESRTAWVRRMFEKDRATYADACRAVLSLGKDEPASGDFAALQKELTERGIADPAWNLAEGSPVTKGTLAYMLCKTLGIKGGLTAGVFGMTRRYALRECLFLRLFARGKTDEFVSGRELIDVLTNAEIFKKEGSLDSRRR